MSVIKKTLYHPRRDADARHIFSQQIAKHKANNNPIVYIDESGFESDMPRTHGYALRGHPCYGKHDWNTRNRTNVIGALVGKHLLTACTFVVNITADIFTAWVQYDLLPKLPDNSVIVMDNATFHKRQDTKNIIEQAGHTILFLPPYSPDLNPIEQKWAHLKRTKQKLRCSLQELLKNESFYLA